MVGTGAATLVPDTEATGYRVALPALGHGPLGCSVCEQFPSGVSLGPLLIATGEAISLRGLEGVPDLPCTTQDEAGLMGKFDT